MNRMMAMLFLVVVMVSGDAMSAEPTDTPQSFLANAQQLLQKRQYKPALRMLEKVRSPALSDRAAIRRAQCLHALGQADEADRLLADITAKKESLDRGEALFTRAYLRCWSATGTEDFRKISRWLDEAIAFAGQSFKPIENAQQDIREIRLSNGPATFDPLLACAGTVANPLTTNWYTDDLTARAAILAIYANSQHDQASDIDKAAEHLLKLLPHTPHLKLDPAIIHRLKADGRSGAFLITRQAWRSLSKERGPRLRFALFLAISGSPHIAVEVFAEVNQAISNQGDGGEDWAIAHLGEAVASYHLNRPGTAIAKLKRFNGIFRQRPMAPLARLVLANMLAGTPDGYADAARLYEQLANHHTKSGLAVHALACWATAAAEREDFNGLATAASLLAKHHPRAGHTSLVRYLQRDHAGGRRTHGASIGKGPITTIGASFSPWKTMEPIDVQMNAPWLYRIVPQLHTTPQSVRSHAWYLHRLELEPMHAAHLTRPAYRINLLWQSPIWQ